MLLKCEGCGANLDPGDDGIAECVYCGAKSQVAKRRKTPTPPRPLPAVIAPREEKPKRRKSSSSSSLPGCISTLVVIAAIFIPLYFQLRREIPELFDGLSDLSPPTQVAPEPEAEPSKPAEPIDCEAERAERFQPLAEECRFEQGEHCGGGRHCIDTREHQGARCIHRRCNGPDTVQCCSIPRDEEPTKPTGG